MQTNGHSKTWKIIRTLEPERGPPWVGSPVRVKPNLKRWEKTKSLSAARRKGRVRDKITPKLGGGRGMSDAYIFNKKSYLKARTSCENQRGFIETKATLSPS